MRKGARARTAPERGKERKDHIMKPYIIEPDEWWSDCGTLRYTDETIGFEVIAELTKAGKVKFLGSSLAYSGDCDFYLDATKDEQTGCCWGYFIEEYPADTFIDEEGEITGSVALAPGFVAMMEGYRDRDETAEYAAWEFAEWCKSIGGRRIMTEADAYPLVDEWMSTQPRPLGCEEVEDFEIVHFLFLYGYETEPDQTEETAA